MMNSRTAKDALKELIAKGHHDGMCEVCGEQMVTVLTGDIGWYCSEECFDENECGVDYDFRAAERRQLGIGA